MNTHYKIYLQDSDEAISALLRAATEHVREFINPPRLAAPDATGSPFRCVMFSVAPDCAPTDAEIASWSQSNLLIASHCDKIPSRLH